MSKDGWIATVERMRDYDEEWILESDVPKIADYLAQIRGTAE